MEFGNAFSVSLVGQNYEMGFGMKFGTEVGMELGWD
jgi:hypothetical protein